MALTTRRVWSKMPAIAAETSPQLASHDRFGCDGSTPSRPEKRGRIAGETGHRPQGDMALHAGDAEAAVAQKLVGKRLVALQILADEAHEIVGRAADLPALDRFLDRFEPRLDAVEPRLAAERQFGEDGYRLGELLDID